MVDLDTTLRSMGLARPSTRSDEEISRSLRRLCKGKFGNMTDIQKQQRGDFGEGAKRNKQ